MERRAPYLRSELALVGEEKDHSRVTDVVVIRPPRTAPLSETKALARTLLTRGFLPILASIDFTDDERWFPTDEFREVGKWVFDSSTYQLSGVLDLLKAKFSLARTKMIERRVKDTPIAMHGGNFVYSDFGKIFFYTFGDFPLDRGISPETFLARMNIAGWRTEFFDTKGFNLPGREYIDSPDLDFLIALFKGKDKNPHIILASSFAKRVPSWIMEKFPVHRIPDGEALNGGCNIADLRRGKVLIVPNRKDAPTTFRILSEFAHPKVDIIEAFPNFLDGGGGPRCSIGSFSI